MKKLILKLLEEVDPDIKEAMLSKADCKYEPNYLVWELMPSAALTAIEWQRMRNEQRGRASASKSRKESAGTRCGSGTWTGLKEL